MHFPINLLSGDKSKKGLKLKGDSGSSALDIGIKVACLNISGKFPAVEHLFVILHSKWDRMEEFSFMRCTGILSSCSLVYLKLLIIY